MSLITTVDELRAAMAAAPGDALVLLFLHNPPRAAWLGTVHYDDSTNTLDLHDTGVIATPGHGLVAVQARTP